MTDTPLRPDPAPKDDDTAWPETGDTRPDDRAPPAPKEDPAIERDVAVNGRPD